MISFPRLKHIKITRKLPAQTIISALVCCLITSGIAIRYAQDALRHDEISKMETVVYSRIAALQTYLGDIQDDLAFTATNPATITALGAFDTAWDELGSSQTSRLKQLYIEQNPNPTGEKHKLNYATDGSQYSYIHSSYHPWFRQFLEARGYYDIFLFDMDGNLVYTVFKEQDYATNLKTGEYKDTDLGNVFRAAAADTAKQGDSFFFDFRAYAPSHGAPASFIATPVYQHNQKIGVLAFQMPVDRINAIMSVYKGLSDASRMFLVGPDSLMRSDKRYAEETTILKEQVSAPEIQKALNGESGSAATVNSDGQDVMMVYQPVDFLGENYAIILEDTVESFMGPIAAMKQSIILSAAAALLLIAVAAIFAARNITNPLQRVSEELSALAGGDLDITVSGLDRRDEIGELAQSALVFREQAIEKEQLTHERLEADERAAQEKRDLMQQLANEFESEVKGIVSMVAAAATELSLTTEGVVESINRAGRTSHDAVSAADQTSRNVQTVASAAEELSASVKEISSQMQQSNQMVRDSVSRAEVADKQAASLSEATKKVEEVIQLIADIAGQINLLALNATIESARAGEAGKGFAVVASEVKNLASQTDSSIEEITRVISQMNLASGDIVKSLVDIRQSVNHISEASNSVASAVEEQSATTNEIAGSMQNAAQSTQVVSGSLGQVQHASDEASTAAGQILEATKELSQQAEKLDSQVDAFLHKIRNS
jgi:methyl-accepting chemotaxis protein